jgi:hypothetical protein
LLSPQLTALLEDTEMTKRFALCLVYGLIREEEDAREKKNFYALRLDTMSRRQREVEHWFLRLTPPSDQPKLLDAVTNFVFLRLDPEAGIRAIKDVTPDTNILIEPKRVDETLDLHSKSLLSGLEDVVEAFEQDLKAAGPIFAPDGDKRLVGVFRRFLLGNEQSLRRGEFDALKEKVAAMVQDNRGCYEDKFRSDLIDRSTNFLTTYTWKKVTAGDRNRLIDKVETYVLGKIRPKWRESSNPLERDLYLLLDALLWEEVTRQERLRDTEG